MTGRVTRLFVSGISGAVEAASVEAALAAVPGVYAVGADVATRVATVRHDSSVGAAQLIGAVEEAGFAARRAVPGEAAAGHATTPWGALRPGGPTAEQEMALYRALSMLGGLVLLGLLGAGLWFGGRRDHLAYSQLIIATVAQAIVGGRFYAGAWRELARRRVGPDTLVALASSIAYFRSAHLALWQMHSPHFATATVLLSAAAVTRWLTMWLQLRAARTLRDLVEIAPASARVLRGGREEDVLACDLLINDLVTVRPGERFPADGVVVDGQSAADESLLTGEALPRPKAGGAEVLGGTLNGHGRVVFRVTRAAGQTVLARMVGMVRQAEGLRPRLSRAADRIGALLGPGALLVALVSWLAVRLAPGGGEGDQAMLCAVAVLAAASPLSVCLAVPGALNAALGRAARLGILVRSGPVLEACSRLKAVAFERTGTVTLGQPELVETLGAGGADAQAVLALAAGLSEDSPYSLDLVIREAARARSVAPAPVSGRERVQGRGIAGQQADRRVLLGSRSYMDEQGVYLGSLAEVAEKHQASGRRVLLVASGGNALGVLAFQDPLKLGAVHVVGRLRAMGMKPYLVTGDSATAARALAAELGIPAEQVLPDVKRGDRPGCIRAIRERCGAVAMVGDGRGDAPALQEADVGLAIGCGADLEAAGADILLLGEDLRGVLRVLRMARRTVRAMRINLSWAVIFNVVAMAATGLGFVERPERAAAAAALAALLVAFNSYQLSLRPGILSASAGGG